MEKQDYLKIPLEEVVNDDFAKYAKYIIQDRALPDIRDGLKPVQRRIIYAMNNLHLFYDQPHKKSARTVGEVIGKYHPHGDTSIYEAMVRMSQDWKNNAILIDMHGNKGSIDGDGPAAMRYTECRLSRFGQEMVNNIDKDCVEFMNNFDDSEKEPSVFPTLLPNLLINGANGIAAGYATNIPPFNLIEAIDAIITRIDSPNCYLKSILNVMPGPDFPTGGIILNPQGISEAYEKGKGKITIRGEIEEVSKKLLMIKSIPYDTNKSNIIHQIDLLREKYDGLGITEVRDESDKNGISIALDINKPHNIDLIKNLIYKETQLQIAYTINMVAIINRKPIQFPILVALDAFIDHIEKIVIASSQYDLNKAKSRKEIVEGLIKAISVIDDVVDIIRRASNKEEAKQKIMNFLSFTNNQAEAIVQLRLYRLTNTDVTALKQELEQLNETINNLQLLIQNKTLRDNHIKNQLREYKKMFGHKRLTQISHESEKIQISEIDKVEDRDVVIACTYDGYLKCYTKNVIGGVDLDTINIKNGDMPVALFNSNLRHKVVLITSKGNYITIPVHKIPQSKWKDIGYHVNNLINVSDNEKIIFAFNYTNDVKDPRGLLFLSKNGKTKKIAMDALTIGQSVKLTGCMNLDDNDELVSALLIQDIQKDNYLIVFISNVGNAYQCNLEEITLVGRTAAGIKAMNLKPDQYMVGAIANNTPNTKLLLVAENGMKRINFAEVPQSKRPSTGKSIVTISKANNHPILHAYKISSTNLISVVSLDDLSQFVKASDVPVSDANAKVSRLGSYAIKNASIYTYITNILGMENTAPATLVDEETEEEKTEIASLLDFENE